MSALQKANPLQQALNKGETAFGAWNMLPGTHVARALAASGVSWVCIDCEHGALADSQMHDHIVAVSSVPSCSPIVRIPSTEPWLVKRALDAGAHGIMVPLVKSTDEVRAFVASTKFPPKGTRGFGSPFSSGSFQTETALNPLQYLRQANDALVTIVQIETAGALSAVNEIAALDGVDVLFVAPFDLGMSIGHPIMGQMADELKMAIGKIKMAALENGKKLAVYCTSGDQARNFVNQGFHMVVVANDFLSMQTHVSQQLGLAKGSVVQSAVDLAKGAAQKVTGGGQ